MRSGTDAATANTRVPGLQWHQEGGEAALASVGALTRSPIAEPKLMITVWSAGHCWAARGGHAVDTAIHRKAQ